MLFIDALSSPSARIHLGLLSSHSFFVQYVGETQKSFRVFCFLEDVSSSHHHKTSLFLTCARSRKKMGTTSDGSVYDTEPPFAPSAMTITSSSSQRQQRQQHHHQQYQQHRDQNNVGKNKRNGGVKSRDAENAWKGKLREEVLRRVKENRNEILSAARNNRAAMMEKILSAEMTRSSVKREREAVSTSRPIEEEQEQAHDEEVGRRKRTTVTVKSQGKMSSSKMKREAPSPTSSVDSRSWDDVLATSSSTREISKEEYDELINAMLTKFEAEAKEEEEFLLEEQKYAFLDEADERELDLALEQMQAWEIDDRNSDPNDPVVLCPLCKTRRLLATRSSNKSRVFCGCENGFRVDIDGGLVFLRDRLASAFENHRAFTSKEGENACAEVDLKFQFGLSQGTTTDELNQVLFASCKSCGFLEAIV